MKLFNKKNFSTLISHFSSQKGFTLIELLIVIAILGILAAGILVSSDPVDKINTANDAKVQNDVSGAGRAEEAYAVGHNGFYAATLAELVLAGELKRVPTAPTGYAAYGFVTDPPVCVSGACEGITITSQLKSRKFTRPGTPFWRYESPTGKSCAVPTAATPCP